MGRCSNERRVPRQTHLQYQAWRHHVQRRGNPDLDHFVNYCIRLNNNLDVLSQESHFSDPVTPKPVHQPRTHATSPHSPAADVGYFPMHLSIHTPVPAGHKISDQQRQPQIDNRFCSSMLFPATLLSTLHFAPLHVLLTSSLPLLPDSLHLPQLVVSLRSSCQLTIAPFGERRPTTSACPRLRCRP